MNAEISPRPIELTDSIQNTYSGSRLNIMPDVIQTEVNAGGLSRGTTREPIVSSRVNPDRVARAKREMVRRISSHEALIEGLAGGEPRSPDSGIRIDEFREKVRPEYDQANNASLEDAMRAQEASRLLGIEKGLTAAQEEALLAAHKTKNPFAKVRFLRDAGFDKDQTRALIEAHLAGMSPATQGGHGRYDTEIEGVITDTDPTKTIDRASFTDPDLQQIAGRVKDLYDSDTLDEKSLASFYESVTKHSTEDATANIAESKRLKEAIQKISQLDSIRLKKNVDKRDPYAEKVNLANAYKGELENYDDKLRVAEAAGNAVEVTRLKDARKEWFKLARDAAKEINPQSGGNYDDVFRMIVEEGNSLDYIVNRIISPPLDSESGDWSLGFYGQNNLDSLINLIRTDKENPDLPPELRALRNQQYQSIGEIEEAVRLAHEVNKAIVNADLRTFSAIAGGLDAEKLTRLGKVKGVGAVARLLEAEFGSTIAKDKWVNSTNYAALMGRAKDADGLVSLDQSGSANTSFTDMVNRARDRVKAEETMKATNPAYVDQTITAEMRELGALEDWEVSWAFNIGKSMYNMWLRAGEWISQGQVPEGDKSYVSFPQETIARIMNWPVWMLKRFEVSWKRGGKDWLEHAQRIHQAKRQFDGYGEIKIEKIGGKSIADFEMPDAVGVRGWWATWREKQLLMSTMPMRFTPRGSIAGATIEREGHEIEAGEVSHLGVLLDSDSAIKIKVPGGYEGSLSGAPTNVKEDYLRSVYLDKKGNIRGDYKRGLGASLFFLKPSSEHRELNGVKGEIRNKIWAQAAEENPLGVLPFLEGLKYKGGETVSIVPGPDAAPAVKLAWRAFERKLIQLNEIKMQKIKQLDPDLASASKDTVDAAVSKLNGISFASMLAEEATRRAGGIVLDDREKGWLKTIAVEGKRAAPQLANIRFEFNPFLNDAPLEKVDYTIVGAEGYRRMLNDTSGFQQANDALIKMMDNPLKYKEPEEMIETMMPFIDGVGGILGTDVGQEKGFVWIQAALEMYERAGNVKVRKLNVPGTDGIELKKLQKVESMLRQSGPVNALLEATHRPNSIAQKIAGPDAAVYSSQKLFETMHEFAAAGVVNHIQEEKWKKRFGGPLWYGFLSFFRGALAGGFTALTDVSKRSFKDLNTG